MKALDQWLSANPGASVAEIREAAIELTGDVLGAYGDAASSLACELFDSVMEAEGVAVPAAQVYDGYREGAVEGTVRRVVGDVDGTQESLDAFKQSVGQLAENEVRRAANSTVEKNVERASKTKAGSNVRYARVPTKGIPCDWCAMLASRGFVYRSAQRAEASSHHHCSCTIVPGVQGKTQVAGYDPDHYYDVWKNREKYEATSVIKGSEREREYGVRYDKAMVVDADYVASDEYAAKYSGLTEDAEVDEMLLAGAKHALERNSGADTESMTFIDVRTKETLTIDCDIPGGIQYTDEARAFIDARQDMDPCIAVVHNHPNGTPPSADDLSKMAEHNYAIGVVAGHNGQVYAYSYHGPVLDEKLLDSIAERAAAYCDMGYDVDRAFSEVFAGFGMSYELRKGGNHGLL